VEAGTESGNFCALIYNPAQRESSYLHLILIKPTGFLSSCSCKLYPVVAICA